MDGDLDNEAGSGDEGGEEDGLGGDQEDFEDDEGELKKNFYLEKEISFC